MDGVVLSPLKKIHHKNGDIFHALKASDQSFDGFGEAYFSFISKNEIKGWKKHSKMTLNLVVPVGKIEFVIYDGHDFFSVKLSNENYQRLTIRPNLWLAFKGLSDDNMLLNLASIEHDPAESENVELHDYDYDWGRP